MSLVRAAVEARGWTDGERHGIFLCGAEVGQQAAGQPCALPPNPQPWTRFRIRREPRPTHPLVVLDNPPGPGGAYRSSLRRPFPR